MLFRSRKRTQAEKDRKVREDANRCQGFLRLPAELRNQIYELVIPSGHEIKQTNYQRYQLPACLHVCRYVREEVLPIFYGRNLVIIILQHLWLASWHIS